MLQAIVQQSKADYVGASFGTTPEVLHFWQRNNFSPVYLSMKRDASSGTHSVIVLLGNTKKGMSLLASSAELFKASFPHLLSDPFKHLGSDIALRLLSSAHDMALTNHDRHVVKAFAEHQRGYENSFTPIWTLVSHALSNDLQLTTNEKRILLIKVLQKQTWKSTVTKMAPVISGKKEGLTLLRKAIKHLLLLFS